MLSGISGNGFFRLKFIISIVRDVESINAVKNNMEMLICPVCKDCSLSWERCDNCEYGYSFHDCGEDTCMCRYPENNVRCDICDGKEGWYNCLDKDCKFAELSIEKQLELIKDQLDYIASQNG